MSCSRQNLRMREINQSEYLLTKNKREKSEERRKVGCFTPEMWYVMMVPVGRVVK